MLKAFKISSEQDSVTTSDSENNDEVAFENNKSTLESTEFKSKSKKRKSEEIGQGMKIFKPKPNFFLGFQVYDVEIHQKVKQLQENIIAKNPLLHPALVNVSTLHVTLAVTYLATQTDIKTIKKKLDNWAIENRYSFFEDPIALNFTGVQTFNNVVAYVDIEKCQNYYKLSQISESLNNLLSSAGFLSESKSFTPHLTVLKLSKDFKLIKLKKFFKNDFELLKKCNENFGSQEIRHIQLLSMEEPKDEKGYYKCLHQINMNNVQLNMKDMDHSECCNPIPKPKKT